jgi:hypothetical protein
MVADVLDALRAQGVLWVRAAAVHGDTGRTMLLEEAGFRVVPGQGSTRQRDGTSRTITPAAVRESAVILFEQEL